jgi:hypothetical protein
MEQSVEYVMFSQAKKLEELLAPSDCSEWLVGVYECAILSPVDPDGFA